MFERCLYFNSNVLVRRLNRHWDEAFAAQGLAPSHGYLLRLVLAEPGSTQQHLADQLSLDRSTIARFLDRLEHKSLIVRRSNDRDPRIKTVWPTDGAIRLQAELQTLGDALYESMCDRFGAARVAALVKEMREIADGF